jgi:hydrogenase expression/formation protein HypD
LRRTMMKFIDEFRNADVARDLSVQIHKAMDHIGHAVCLMEVCGTHTMSIYRHGIQSIIPPSLKLLSGPGCPVCVTPNRYLDKAVAFSRVDDVIITTFGDMLNVPGSSTTLARERAAGRDIRMVYSPLDALAIARRNPDKKIIFLAVGFETTSPTIAGTLLEAFEADVSNFFASCAHKLIPPAMKLLVEDPDLQIDGFICPAHVSAIIGSGAYEFLARDHGIPCVITGFEPLDVLQGIFMLLQQIIKQSPRVENQYSRVVKHTGNPAALRLLHDVFDTADAPWRGLGTVPGSGLTLAEAHARFDADAFFQVSCEPEKDHPGCLCGEVIKGKIEPEACRLFRSVCTPVSPVGPCMVSQEGTCATHYKYGYE